MYTVHMVLKYPVIHRQEISSVNILTIFISTNMSNIYFHQIDISKGKSKLTLISLELKYLDNCSNNPWNVLFFEFVHRAFSVRSSCVHSSQFCVLRSPFACVHRSESIQCVHLPFTKRPRSLSILSSLSFGT